MERKHGKGNYNRYTGSIKIGFNGIFSFSTIPLTFLLFLGIIVFITSIIGIIYVLFNKIIFSSALDFVVVQHNTQDNVIELTRNSQRTNALELKVPSIIRNRIF